MHQAVILAGGLGTRLRAILSDLPKPMAPVAGRPVLEHQIAQLREHGVKRVVLAVGHMAERVQEHFGDGAALGVEIHYALEKELLGTSGAILHARPLLDDGPLLALNGDSLVPSLDYTALVRCHRRHVEAAPATVGTMVVIDPPEPGAYGVVEMDGDAVVRFREKAPIRMGADLISAGVYALEPTVFDYITPGRPCSIEFETFPAVLQSGGRLFGYKHEGFFGDIGTPEGYERVRQHVAD